MCLQRCYECGGSEDINDCSPRPGSQDGAGIPNADIVIYVRTEPCRRGTLASAGACQLEKQLDR